MKTTLGLIVLVLLACNSASRPSPAGNAAAGITPYDDHYGIYLNSHKVGWMRTRLSVGTDVVLTTELRAKVGGLGQVADMQLDEKRVYDVHSGGLKALSFRQAASTGAVEVQGQMHGDTLALRVIAGREVTEQQVVVHETVRDVQASTELARHGVVGQTTSARHFDPSVLKNLEVEHRIAAVETRLLDGVSARVVRIDSLYRELGISESSWVDAEGTILESHVGGFFVARLEPEEVAKELTYQQDILVSAVVRPPVPMTDAEARQTLVVTLRGFGDLVPPTSERQRVEVRGDATVLRLTRDPHPPALTLAELRRTSGAATDEDLQATPFIQAHAPAIVAAAQEAIGDATDVFAATTRLVHFVAHHVRDAYVPAYSNAIEALESARGDCTEHAVLFVALARALGIPARVAVGIAYWADGNGFGWHAWSEVRIGGRWLTVDPTWDQPIADVTHLKLAEGDPAQQARIVMLLGKLEIVALQ